MDKEANKTHKFDLLRDYNFLMGKKKRISIILCHFLSYPNSSESDTYLYIMGKNNEKRNKECVCVWVERIVILTYDGRRKVL